ncbi:MAG: hypothetical protein ACRYFR_18900 [Janthinobacterium lividum]
MEQTIAECRREVAASNSQVQRRVQSLSFSQYDFDKRQSGRDAVHETIQLPGTYRELDVTRYAAGSLWIYATTLHDGWGDHQYFVYNPDTGALLHFIPEASIAAKSRLYASKRAQIQGVAAGTGVAGGYLEKGFLGTSALFLTGGVAAELGAYAYVAEEVAPVVSRIAVQAYRVAQTAAQAYAKRAAKGALLRMGLDAGFQFGTGYLAAKPGKNSRMVQAANGVNGTSVVAAGAISVGEAKPLAKFLVAFGSSAMTNLVTVNGENFDKYQTVWHMPDLHDSHQAVEYARNVILGTLFDQSKEYGSEWVAKRLAGRAEEWAAQASGQASKAVLKWVTETRVALPASFVIGGVPETLKKRWENNNAAEEEAKARAEKAKTEKAAAAHRRAAAPAIAPKAP